jgi:hypothetical protein
MVRTAESSWEAVSPAGGSKRWPAALRYRPIRVPRQLECRGLECGDFSPISQRGDSPVSPLEFAATAGSSGDMRYAGARCTEFRIRRAGPGDPGRTKPRTAKSDATPQNPELSKPLHPMVHGSTAGVRARAVVPRARIGALLKTAVLRAVAFILVWHRQSVPLVFALHSMAGADVLLMRRRLPCCVFAFMAAADTG